MRYTNAGRLGAVLVGVAGDRLADNIADAVTRATLDLSTTQTSQLRLVVTDPTLELVAGGWLGKRTPVRYAGLALEVAVREITTVGTIPALGITARARGVQALRRRRGTHVWRGLSYTQWARMEARAAGLAFVGEPSAPRRQIIRKAADGGQPAESSWDVLGRGASELGYVLFESAGTLYFARPTWLAKHLPMRHVTWSASGTGHTTPGLLKVPEIRDSDDDLARGYSGSLSCDPELADDLGPGVAVTVHGVGPYAAVYLVNSLGMDLDGVSPCTVSIATPVNPDPVAMTEDGERARDPKTGRFI